MKTVFLDLDGTLTDPKPGITKSIVYALEKLGLEAPEPDDLTWCIGPPLLQSLVKLGVPDPQVALGYYRERFSTIGLLENRVYDGIPEVLDTLSGPYRLCLATAKPRVYAIEITKHFGLDHHLAAQFGPELDGLHNDKGELLAFALENLSLEAKDCVMVGDRHHDIDAARSVDMNSIAVTWGYGSPEEYAAATATCATPETLAEQINRVLG